MGTFLVETEKNTGALLNILEGRVICYRRRGEGKSASLDGSVAVFRAVENTFLHLNYPACARDPVRGE
jgi:hypothetical protein